LRVEILQAQVVWSYALVFVPGCLLGSFLYIEYKQNTKLIEDNQAFVQQAIIKTIKSNQQTKLNKFHNSVDYFKDNWKTIKPAFWVIENGEVTYPFRFLGEKSRTPSELWKYYETNQVGKLSKAAQKRVSSIHAIKSLKTRGHSKALEQAIGHYLSIANNTKLSPLEEVISGLLLLKTADTTDWSQEFIELIVEKGSDDMKALVDYLFMSSSAFTDMDAKIAFREIYNLYEVKKMNAAWLKSNEGKFWQRFPVKKMINQHDYSLINNNILLQKSHGVFYLLPIDLNHEIALVAKELKKRGLLDVDDEVRIPKNIDYPDLASVQFLVTRMRWNKQRFSQKAFFAIKIIVLMASMYILFYLLKTLNLKYQNYRDYLDLRENFLNMVNHELKTPLASVRIMVEALEKRVSQNMGMKDYPERIVNQLDKLWLMVDNLLSLNRIKSGEYIVDYTPVNMYELLESLSLRMTESSRQSILIKNHFNKDFVVVADQMLIELLLNNLITNAIKYCDKKTIEMRFEHGQENGQFFLYDNARGVDTLEWDKVFDEFYRSERQQKGTGVGLALCRRIMRLHHGEIGIHSSSEDGTCWYLTFALDQPLTQDK